VPLEIMCSGPKSLHAAAALADRITLSVGAAPERIRWALERIDEGLRDAGRSRADVKVGAFLPLCLDDSRSNAAERLRTAVALTAHMASLPGMDLDGQPERLRRVTRQLRDAYDYRNHNLQPDNPHGRSVDPEFASWYGIGGPPAYVVERMGQLVEAGLSYIFLGKTPLGEREALADKVMPVVRKLRPGW
jgi:5,10-methylenetetrahydromethanopterin reductase